MEAYRNYRHRAAQQLSRCYEAQNQFATALEWAIRARDEFSYQSWCGTCRTQNDVLTASNIARLTAKAAMGR
jgi:hypothetical protein